MRQPGVEIEDVMAAASSTPNAGRRSRSCWTPGLVISTSFIWSTVIGRGLLGWTSKGSLFSFKEA